MSTQPQREPRLTGGIVLAVALGAFGVILAVNLTLAWFAVGTFSGLVVDNSYVASQSFDHDRRAQEALGWRLALAPEGDQMRVDFADATGRVVRPDALAVVVGRPTSARSDRTLDLHRTPTGYVAEAALEPGNWMVIIDASAADGTAYHRRENIVVPKTP